MLPEFLAAGRGADAGPRPRSLERADGRRAARTGPIASRRATTPTARSSRVDYDGPGDGRVVRRYLATPRRRRDTTSEVLSARGGLRRHVPRRGEPRLRVGLPLLRGRLHVPAGPLPQPRALRARASRAGSRSARTIGLVGAEMASQPGDRGALPGDRGAPAAAPSPSSLKADSITPALARALGAGGNRSVTVAPEAGSERMRRVINKNLTEAEILRAAEWLVGGGVEALKLYVMVGLPTETDDGRRRRSSSSRTKVRARLDGRRTAEGRAHPRLDQSVRAEAVDAVPVGADGGARRRSSGSSPAPARSSAPIPAVQVETESPREAYLQTLLSRGDRRVAPIARAPARAARRAGGRRCGRCAAARHDVVDPDRFVHRPYDADELLPWDFIDHARRQALPPGRAAQGARRAADAALRHAHVPHVRRLLTAPARDRRRSGSTSARSTACARALEAPHGARFRARVFTAGEQALLRGAPAAARFESYAARFAAKEAAMKALGHGLGDGRRLARHRGGARARTAARARAARRGARRIARRRRHGPLARRPHAHAHERDRVGRRRGGAGTGQRIAGGGASAAAREQDAPRRPRSRRRSRARSTGSSDSRCCARTAGT